MAANTQLTLSFPEPDIAVLTLDDPESSANVLSRHVLESLERHLDELDKRKDLAGLVIASAKPGMFIAGADLKEFVASLDAPKERSQRLLAAGAAALRPAWRRATTSPWRRSTASASAAARSWRCGAIAASCPTSDKTAYGFPEVKLGLFPGWGGTARTPRMIGLSNAVELVTSGENIDPQAAAAMGLANDVVDDRRRPRRCWSPPRSA